MVRNELNLLRGGTSIKPGIGGLIKLELLCIFEGEPDNIHLNTDFLRAVLTAYVSLL